MNLEQFVERFQGPKHRHGSEWQVCCPVHKDSNPSASVRESDSGKILFHCHGCNATMADVCERLGIDIIETMGQEAIEKKKERDRSWGTFVCAYKYTDETGKIVFIKDRYVKDGKKTFIQKCPPDVGSTKKWEWGLSKLVERGQRRPVYMLPELLHGIRAGREVWFVEGEKDALSLKAEGLVATTTSEGANGGWQEHYSEYFEGAKCVIIVPDNDKPPADTATPGWQGQDYAVLKREKLTAAGIKCRVVEVPELVNGKRCKDVTDYFEAGGTVDELQALAQAAMDASEDPWKHPRDRPDAPVIPEAPEGAKAAAKTRPKSEATMRKNWKDENLPADTRCTVFGDWLIYQISKKKQSIAWAVEAATRYDGKGITRDHRNAILCRVIIFWLNDVGKLYYHKEHRDFRTGMFFLKSDKSLCNVDSDWFKSWVSRRCGINREEARFKRVWSAIQDEVLQGEQATGVLPESYFARRGSVFPAPGERKACAIYISNGVGQMAKVTAKGVEMVDNGTDGVLFPADKTLDPWELTTTPRDPFSECAIWKEMEVANPRDRLIFRLWAHCLPLNNDAKPPLCVTGGAGSGKTTAVRGLFRLYGITQRNLTVDSSEKGAQSFWVSMNAGGLLLLDNMDTSVRWFCNAAESASTGAAFEAKRLYTDSELVRLLPRAWLAVTSLNPSFASSAALADRTIFISLLRRANKDTKESEIYSEVSQIRNDGLTFVAQTIQKVLADDWNGNSPNRRHPDFGKAAVRIGRALGVEDEAVKALHAVEADKYLFNLKNDVFGELFMRLVTHQGDFDAAAFFEKIKSTMGEEYVRNSKWNPMRVGKAIDRLWESLRFAYQIDKKFVRGKAIYSVNPQEFILREAHQFEADASEGVSGTSSPSTTEASGATSLTSTDATSYDGEGADLTDDEIFM